MTQQREGPVVLRNDFGEELQGQGLDSDVPVVIVDEHADSFKVVSKVRWKSTSGWQIASGWAKKINLKDVEAI